MNYKNMNGYINLIYILIIIIIILISYIFIYLINNKFSYFGDNLLPYQSFTSAVPAIFGPYLWTSFHLISVNYPDNPLPQTQNSAIQFIKSLPWLLPCDHCGYHLLEFIEEKYLPEFNSNLSEKLNIITKNRYNLVTFFTELHNDVSQHVDKNIKRWSTEDTIEYYSKGKRFNVNNIKIWKNQELKRSYDN